MSPHRVHRPGQLPTRFRARADRGNDSPSTFLLGLALAGVLPLLFPEYTKAAMPWTSGALILLCVYQAAYKIRFPSLGSWFVVFFCPLNLALPAIAPIMEIPLPAEPRAASIFLFFNTSGLALFFLGYYQARQLKRPLFPTRGPYLNRPAAERLSTTGLLIGGGILALVVFYAGGISNTFTLSKFELKLIQEGHALNLSLPFFGVAVCLSLSGALGRSNRARLFASFGFLLVTASILFLVYRTRHLPIELITSFVLGLVIVGPLLEKAPLSRALGQRMPQTKQTAIALVCLMAIAILALVARATRGEFDQGLTSDRVAERLESTLEHALDSGVFAMPKLTMEIIEIVPAREDYLYGRSYYRLLFSPIPRTLWPEKPRTSMHTMAAYLRPTARQIGTLTLPVSIVGDLYVNFGLFGVLGFSFWGWLFGRLDKEFSIPALLFASSSSVAIFHFVRGSVSNPIFALIVAGLTARVVGRQISSSHPAPRKHASRRWFYGGNRADGEKASGTKRIEPRSLSK